MICSVPNKRTMLRNTIRICTRKHNHPSSLLPVITTTTRFMSTTTTTSTSLNPIITKQELQDLIQNQKENYTLIDVRNPDETVSQMPLIDTAVNIPLPDFGSAMMEMDEKRFKHQYGFPKPQPNDRIIVYCRSGARSTTGKITLHYPFDIE